MVQQLGEGSATPTDSQHTPAIIQPSSSQPQKAQKPRKPIRKETQVPEPSGPTESVIDETVHKELGDKLIASLKRRVKKLEKKNKSRTHRLKRLYKVGLSTRIESSGDKESLDEDASKQERRINSIDADEDITLVSVAKNEMFDVDVLAGEEVFVAEQNENVVEEVVDAAQVSTTTTIVTITTEEITMAQALEALKISKPKVKGIVFKSQLKLFEFDRIQEMFDRAFKRVNTFEDFRTELGEGKEKRAGEELIQEITKKQKVKDSQKRKEKLLSNKDEVWKLQKGYKVLEWKLYDSCGVHSLMMQSMQIYMLVEKKYPLTPHTLSMMLEKKLIIDYESEMAYQLLKLIKKQLKN
uniref:Uncharacterized protein n=1 Tax=Tanacetum cinerariifolium TaxID=118510 RepID=A0A699JTR6_TANCI|nr:hypothetical protein [Tanacetum cinerariifolium]